MIYFIQAENGGPIKIGHAKDRLEQRLAELQIGNPYILKVLGTIEGDRKVEYALHKKFRHVCYRNEWFDDCEEIREFIRKIDTFDTKTLFPKRRWYEIEISFNYKEFLKSVPSMIREHEWTYTNAAQHVNEELEKRIRSRLYPEWRITMMMEKYREPIQSVIDEMFKTPQQVTSNKPVYGQSTLL